MNEKEKARLDQIRGKKEVQRALKASKRKRMGFRVIATTKDKISIATHVLVLLGLAVLNYIIAIDAFLNLDILNNFLPQQLQLSEKLVGGAMTVVLILTLSKFIKVLFINGMEDPATKFNLKRVLNLIIGIILFFIILSVLFANWYTAVVSLGLISLILGFALQTPITSFIAWIHIIITRPYKVGDRIKMGEATGDVIDIGYLETTLWETVGDSLSSDHLSGRLIRFPNSNILSNPVYNYSWPLFPYIWGQASFSVGFNSDLAFVEEIMRQVAEEVTGNELSEKVHLYHQLLAETPVDINQIREKPQIYFRVNDSVWMEVTIRFLVEPKQAGDVKSRIVRNITDRFLKHPDKVVLPMGTER